MTTRKIEVAEDEYILLVAIWEHASDMLMCEKMPEFGKQFDITAESQKKRLKELVDEYEQISPTEYPF